MPVVKIHTALDDRTASVGKIFRTDHKVFCQISINDQRLKQKVWINAIVIEGLVALSLCIHSCTHMVGYDVEGVLAVAHV